MVGAPVLTTWMKNVTGLELKTFPWPSGAVLRTTVTAALPPLPGTGVKVSTPVGEIAGWLVGPNRPGVLLVTLNVRPVVLPLGGRPRMLVAHWALYRPLVSGTVTSAPGVKLGAK